MYLLYDIQKWLILLLIPVLRALLTDRNSDAIIYSSLTDIAFAGVLLIYAYTKWRQARYSLHEGLMFRRGLVWQRELHIFEGHAASIEVERTPLMWLVKGRRVRINTAGLRKRADATLYLPEIAAEAYDKQKDRYEHHYVAPVLPILVLSASSSNAALGFLTLAPILRQAGQIIGREVTGDVYGLVNRLISFGLPPLLNTTANILIIGWCFAFLRTFIRTADFYSERSENQLHLISGMISRRNTYIDCSRITTLEIRQTLFMRLFHLYSVIITVAGYGREKGARPVIIPAARPEEIRRALKSLLPEYPTCSHVLHPDKHAFWAYTWLPLLFTLCSLVPLVMNGIYTVIAALWFIIGSWWLCIRLYGYLRAGFGVDERAVTMRYPYGLALYEIHIPQEVADCIVIYRNPWQIRKGTCTVELRTFGEKRRRHRVNALPYESAKELTEQLMKGKAQQ